jgi:hypothetical protein
MDKKSYDLDDDRSENTTLGLGAVLAATDKILAVNRGLVPPDERDSWQFKRIHTPDKLMRERVRLDADSLRRTFMRNVSRHRSLAGVHAGFLNNYTEGQIVQNPLSSPLEEINPLQIAEQKRRVTQMGPGGVGSDDAVTDDMRAIHPSQFGFVSIVEGPECFDELSEVYTLRGWLPWSVVSEEDVFACRVNDKLEWHRASRIVREFYKGPLIVGEHETVRLAVTPGHRVLYRKGAYCPLVAGKSEEVFGTSIYLPIRHEPYEGDPAFTRFFLPGVAKTNNNQRKFDSFCIGDWCEFVGWWLSEGSSYSGFRKSSGGSTYGVSTIQLHQSPSANPEKHARISALLLRMSIIKTVPKGKVFSIHTKQLVSWFSCYKNGCYDKWIPDELFEAPVWARRRMLDALLAGDGRDNVKRRCYCTVSKRLALSVERLAIGLGYTAFTREERDRRPHVVTVNYVVSIHREKHRQIIGRVVSDKRSGKTYGNNWKTVDYEGLVYCATVPGGLLHVRGKKSTSGHWSGNSSRAGVDVRMSWGTRVGADGRVYQRYRDARTGEPTWMSPEDLDGKTLAIPD